MFNQFHGQVKISKIEYLNLFLGLFDMLSAFSLDFKQMFSVGIKRAPRPVEQPLRILGNALRVSEMGAGRDRVRK